MNHTPPIFIDEGSHTIAFFALDNPQTLVIFIHGFNGRLINTWGEFPDFIRLNNDFKNADILFYGYDSLKNPAAQSSQNLYNSLSNLTENSTNAWGIERAFINESFKYEQIVLVAHSLGALVLRKALLLAKRDHKEWLDSCKMILFAPAHHGFKMRNLIFESLSSIETILSGLGLISFPVLENLKPNSFIIQNLLHDSMQLLDKKQGNFTIADQIIWSKEEEIVRNEHFGQDPIPLLVENKAHHAICKPDSQYLIPYHLVVKSLYA